MDKKVKNGTGKSLYFMQLFLCYILKVTLNSVCFNLNYEKTNSVQNVKVGKMVFFVKAFDHNHHKFQLFQVSCKIVKEFETEI